MRASVIWCNVKSFAFETNLNKSHGGTPGPRSVYPFAKTPLVVWDLRILWGEDRKGLPYGRKKELHCGIWSILNGRVIGSLYVFHWGGRTVLLFWTWERNLIANAGNHRRDFKTRRNPLFRFVGALRGMKLKWTPTVIFEYHLITCRRRIQGLSEASLTKADTCFGLTLESVYSWHFSFRRSWELLKIIRSKATLPVLITSLLARPRRDYFPVARGNIISPNRIALTCNT